MKKISLVLVALVVSLTDSSWAEEPPELKDFAYGLELDADGSSAIYRVALPEDVYRYTTRKDLGDLRVFNSNMEIVPHSIQHRKHEKVETSGSFILPVFPLYGPQIKRVPGYSMHIQTDTQGTIINVEDGRTDDTSKIQAYIIDASKLEYPPDKLILEWFGDNEESFTTTVSVSYSNDLNTWNSLVANASLAKLKYQNHELGNFTIHLPIHSAKYYKLTWPAGKDKVHLVSLTAQGSEVIDMRSMQWKNVTSNFTKSDPTVYEYNSQASLPVEKVNVVLPYKNILLDIVLKSRSDFNEESKTSFRGLVYSMDVEGQTLSNEQISIPLTTDRYWSLETSVEGKLKEYPQLQLGWVPHELYFVAQGDPPFKLAFGGADVPSPPASTNSFFESIGTDLYKAGKSASGYTAKGREGVGKGSSSQFQQGYSTSNLSVETAKVTNKIKLGGEAMLKPRVELPWKRWVLWGVLVAGVCLLAWMALNLSKQMKSN